MYHIFFIHSSVDGHLGCFHWWEFRVQDTGLPENSQTQGILICVCSLGGIHLDSKTWLHPTACRLQCCTPHAKQQARQEHSPTHQQTGCLKSYETHRHPKTHHPMWPCPSEGKDSAPPTRVQALVPPTRKPTQVPGPTSPIGGGGQTTTLQPVERRPQTQ